MTREELLKDYQEAIDLGDTELEAAIAAKLEALDADKSRKDLPIGNRFLLGVGNSAIEDAMGIGQVLGGVSRADVDAQRNKFKDLKDDIAFNVGGVTGKVADVLIPGGALKNFGGYIPKIGNAVSKLGEMVASPTGIRQALAGGAVLGATQPVGTGDSALKNTAWSSTSGAEPMVAMKVLGSALNMGRGLVPTNSALKQIQEIFNDGVPDSVTQIGGKYQGIDGIKPTIAMLTEDPGFRRIEQNARVRNGGKFAANDEANAQAVYAALANKAIPDQEATILQEALNNRLGPIREDAMFDANMNPNMVDPLRDWIGNTSQAPGVRESLAMPVLNKADRQTGMADVMAQDLYTLRKELDSTLDLKTLVPDELTNAAKNNRRLVTELINEIDTTLSGASGGKWDDYLSQYSQGMKPIEEGRAFQNVLDAFENNRKAGGVPVITPQKLRMAIGNDTYKNMGKKGYVDMLSPEGRQVADSAIEVMGDIERARMGVRGVDGSQTTPLLTSLASSMAPKGGLLGTAIDWARKAGIRTANGILDDAAYDPVLMQELLDKYHKSGVVGPYKIPGLLPYISSASAAGMPYIFQQ